MTPSLAVTTGEHMLAGLEATVRRLEAELATERLERRRAIDALGARLADRAPVEPILMSEVATPAASDRTAITGLLAAVADLRRQLRAIQPPTLSASQRDVLPMAVALAVAAIQAGVRAGDLRWHGGPSDFTYNGRTYDAPSLIELAIQQFGDT